MSLKANPIFIHNDEVLLSPICKGLLQMNIGIQTLNKRIIVIA